MNTMPVPPNPQLWQAVLTRDRNANGTFVYGVASTRIYCRPVCPSRRPRPDGVEFFETPAEAEQAGYRACHRCKPQNPASPSDAWLLATRDYLDRNQGRRVPLSELASFAGTHISHLQRAFQKAFGLSPLAYQSARRVQAFSAKVTQASKQSVTDSITDVLYDSGYNSASSAYAANCATGITPKVARQAAAGECVVFTVTGTCLGKLLAAATAKGLCRVAFADTSGSLTSEIQSFRQAFHAASLCELASASLPATHSAAAELLAAAVPALQSLAAGEHAAAIPVDLRGTAFQQKVWRALRQLPPGRTSSYSQLAAALGQPTAARAVARACATNSIALAVPCHRVNGANGALTGYRWGVERKRALQAAEACGDAVKRGTRRGKSSASRQGPNGILD